LTISTNLRGFIEAAASKSSNQSAIQDPMSFQKQSSSARETQANAPEKRRAVSLIDLAANLDDPIYRRAIGKLSVIIEELESINATRTQQPHRPCNPIWWWRRLLVFATQVKRKTSRCAQFSC
jgi:hypothetical protein